VRSTSTELVASTVRTVRAACQSCQNSASYLQSLRICGKFLVPSAEKEETRSEQRPLSSCTDNAKETNLELRTLDTTVLLTPEQPDLDSQ